MHETKAPLNNELFKPDDMEAVQKIDVNTSSTDNLTVTYNLFFSIPFFCAILFPE